MLFIDFSHLDFHTGDAGGTQFIPVTDKQGEGHWRHGQDQVPDSGVELGH